MPMAMKATRKGTTVETRKTADDASKAAKATKRRKVQEEPAEKVEKAAKKTEPKDKKAQPKDEKTEKTPKDTATQPRPFAKPRTAYMHAPAQRAETPGTVFVFGNGDCGQLGLGEDMIERKKPYPMAALGGEHVVAVACGGLHTMALTAAGRLWSWGCNDQRALGRSGDEFVPALVAGLDHVSITRVACSDSATFALASTGHVYAWGTFRSADGIMGFSTATGVQDTPVVLEGLTEPMVDVCAGADHALALAASGRVYAWGSGQQGQLGRLVLERRRTHGLRPERLRLQNVQTIGCGAYHSFAVTTDGAVYAWGLNNFFQLGLDSQAAQGAEVVHEPTRVAALSDKNIVQISGGEHHSVALSRDGTLYSFGRSDSHQTGLPFATLVEDTARMQLAAATATEDASAHKKAITRPTAIDSLSDVAGFSCGSNHTLALTREGRAYAWGYGEMLQLGNGEEEDVAQPLLLVGQKIDGKRVLQVGAGGQHSVVLAV